jgi:sortase (surface protein transpeptidase)
MSLWRARHYRIRLHRRLGITITVRRFRLGSHASKQHVFNLKLGRIRQIAIRLERKSRKKSASVHQMISNSLATVLILLGMSGITYSVATLVRQKSIEPMHTFGAVTKSVSKKLPAVLTRSIPTNISIPSQQIDVSLTPVGQAADGSIELPSVLDWLAGWYNLSPTPGERGPAVIVGHVDSYEGTSVFWNLRYLQAGDIINITREDGSTATFQVSALAQYDQSNFPSKLVYGNTNGAELRVITCGGTFDEVTHNYTANTVVYARLVNVANE